MDEQPTAAWTQDMAKFRKMLNHRRETGESEPPDKDHSKDVPPKVLDAGLRVVWLPDIKKRNAHDRVTGIINGGFAIKDSDLGLYRTKELLTSTDAWTKERIKARRFKSKAEAVEGAIEYVGTDD